VEVISWPADHENPHRSTLVRSTGHSHFLSFSPAPSALSFNMHSLALVAILPYFLAASAAILNSPSQLKTLKYDYVIIGGTIACLPPKNTISSMLGGTAGNVVANRLTENPNVSVLVIEAGTE
jgi:hypothetical protein